MKKFTCPKCGKKELVVKLLQLPKTGGRFVGKCLACKKFHRESFPTVWQAEEAFERLNVDERAKQRSV